MSSEPLFLTSRAAVRCARRTHNDDDPLLDNWQWLAVEPVRRAESRQRAES